MIAAVRPTSASSRSGTPAPRSSSASRRPRLRSSPPMNRTATKLGRSAPSDGQAAGSTPSTSATASTVTGPCRSTRGCAPVRSTMVEAACCSDGPPSRYTSTRSPSWSRASSAVTAGGPAGDVGARDRHRPDLTQQLDRHRVQRHAQHDGAVRVAKVPLQRRRLAHDQAQRAGPERADQLAGGVRHGVHQNRRWCATSRRAPGPACRGRGPWPRAVQRRHRRRTRRRRCRRRCRWAARRGGRP